MAERGDPGIRQRRNSRHGLSLTVGVHTAAGRSFGTLHDLSRRGAFLAIDPPPGAGARLMIAVRLNDGSELRLPGQVRHSMSEDSAKLVSGVGIEFDELLPEVALALDAVLERLRTGRNPRG
jgi:hypothetical protein